MKCDGSLAVVSALGHLGAERVGAVSSSLATTAAYIAVDDDELTSAIRALNGRVG